MATQSILCRWRIWAEAVLWLLWLTTCLTAAMARKTQLLPGDASFTFTEPHYNVSIMENSGGKTYLTPSTKMGMYVTDPTLDIRYRIHQGDDNKLFKVEERTVGDFCFLRLRTRSGTHKVINRERETEYLLTIKAVARYRNGPSLTATTEVLVTVLDANDLSPLFYPIRYNIAVLEDTPVHKPIVTVSAEDADIGVNGEVYYSFKEPTETFSIHPTSGEVTLTRSVSYIEQNYYKLTILAEDRGPQVGHRLRISRAELEISIREVNQFAPRIDLQELPAVSEQGMVGTIYAMLYVHDKDYGDNGKIGLVAITEGNNEGHFRLHSVSPSRESEYTIQVARTVDREVTPNGFNLTIQAQDRGTPVRTSTLTVHVRLGDINDQTPQFEKVKYEVDVDEVVPVSTPLLFVQAQDGDLGKNAEVVYGISGGNDRGWFSIDQWTGLISVASPLDAEAHKVVSLEVSATDRANLGSRRSSHAYVQINIRDCNDNAPIFNHTTRTVGISESRPVGTKVYKVSAFDFDEGDNGYISYSIVNEEDTPFKINHFTGQITTKAILDYESMHRVYRLRVRASDWGEPFRRESEMIYEVKIKDVNDNKPQFEKVNCVGYLSRGADIDTKLVVVSAIDFDAGNIISYQIIGGNSDRCFDMEPSTGVVRLKCDLEGHTENFRSLLITASDGKNIAESTTVNITLVNNNRNKQLANNNVDINCRDTDVTKKLSKLLSRQDVNSEEWNSWLELASRFSENTHSPQFIPDNPSKVEVQEGLPVGHKVLTLQAKDPDHGYNGKLVYVISAGNAGGSFKMDTYSGDLLVMSDIDRETQILYVLNITVFDMGIPARSSSMTLQVEVTDINDYAPQFDKPAYLVRIPENIMVNRTILQVRAVDYDEGVNARIYYSILSDTEDFVISRDTGIVCVNRKLDRERKEKYELIIQATDGSPDSPLSSTATATVLLDDINDNAPKFLPENYVVRVREDLPKGTVVMIVTAHDPDMAGGGTVRYHLTEGMGDKFEIDRMTGTIRITNKLDFERQQMYNITAKARDRGDPPLSSHCNIVVEVIDVNENLYAPRFADFVFQGKVSENQAVNTSVMQITANDDDERNPLASPKDYEVVYSVQGGSGQGIFTIDQNGMLWTNIVLDRESQSHYWLTIVARDRGTVPQSSRAEVLIEVQDANDNIPQTLEPVYYPTVVESSPEGTSVVRVQGYDLDVSTSTQLSYDITSGNPQGFFIIDSVTGLITTTRRLLDREKQDEHILEVTVQDNGSPSLSSTTRVVVTVADLNDEEPQFMERMYRVRIPERAATAEMHSLYRVLAHDRDMGANADIDYSIKSGRGNGRFRINAKTGMILSDKDFVADSQYDLTIKAVDNGRPQKRQSARVIFTIVACPNTSVASPAFHQEGVSAQVMESDSVGHMVAIMSAEDRDSTKLWYSITGGNEEDKFSIDNENGNIIVAGVLDWEARREYNLSVSVTDCIHTVTTWLHVSVLDINDNRPQFTASTYEVNVDENTETGASILQVAATDRDEDSRLFYTIHSVTNMASRNKFNINSETGVITTLDGLNREAVARHELVIMVRDQGTPSKRNLARVIIQVQDRNDHSPQFITANFEGRVFETAAVGTKVLDVLATDQDTGINAEIKYSILTGNVGSAFTIDPVMGSLIVVKPLDRSRQAEYHLVVRASDGGSPSLTSNAHVHITVTMADNAPPRFEHDEYTTEIEENKAAGEFVAVISAISKSSVIYEIIQGDNQKRFRVNPNSGVVSTTKVLDYEETSYFNLTVQATNMVEAKALCTLLVHIIDQNDNRPVFTQEQYVGNVSEAAMPGSVILQNDNAPLVVKATDADTNHNSLLVYRIIERSAKEMFTIDTNTGAIRTKADLDHEVSPNHTFTVQVNDLGKPQQSAEVTAKVVINIEDINDSPPEFVEPMYEARLLLPTYKGIAVVTVRAHDKDSGVNSKLIYSISAGDEEHFFQIDSNTGTITVHNPKGLRHSYELTISVSDGTFESIGMVKIAVDETEAAGLRFSKVIYQAEISENRTGVEEVTVLTAVGHALNEHLIFAILNPTSMFQVGSTSGVVQTMGLPFDRETQENYTLVVEVSDQRDPPRVAHTLLSVHIKDENDNAPMFINQPYYAVASIEAQRGEVVKQVTAIDLDKGPNGDVEYSLLGDSEDSRFRIHRKTGEISVKRPLDSEDQNREYNLRVQATDKGMPPLRSEVPVPIKIMNKATPVFDEPFYEVSIPENVPMHTAILTVEAVSPTNQKLIYSISNGDVYSEFAVHFNTGAVTVIDHLDFELWQKYELTLRATDTRTGSYAEAIIHVYLEDVNDQAPSFESLLYVETISEAVGIGTSVLSVSASDKDSGRNAEVVYAIEPAKPGSNHSNYFYIDPVKGIILTKQKLDHELKDKLTFLVTATDHGVPSMSTSVHVTILVLDFNDNAPKFEQPTYDVTITDLVKRGQFVTMVTASDADSSNAGSLLYSIVGGNVKQTFMIDEHKGVVSLSSLRKPVLQASYTLNVSVTDGVFTNFARIRIMVRNSNNHIPVFTQVTYDVDIAENLTPEQKVITVTASDEDLGLYGHLAYSIGSEDAMETFRIDIDTGDVYTLLHLDREEKSVYEVPLVATDGGGRSGHAFLHISVGDRGDNRPQFKMNEYKANIYSTVADNAFVLQVSATDEDLSSNAAIEYSFVPSGGGSQAIDYFTIDTNSGVIRVQKSLKVMDSSVFQFFVRAADKGYLPSENRIPVEIYVMSPVDQPPTFDQEVYTYFIPEDRPLDSIIATVAVAVNSSVVYSIVPGSLPYTNVPPKFNISQEGKISVVAPLDREVTETFELTVKAETEATPALVAYTHVTVQIMDVNDNAPKFESNPYRISVAENAQVGSKVIHIIARDADTGVNADVSYAFALEDTEVSNMFAIDPTTGWITTLVGLNREDTDEYIFNVIATDRGVKEHLSAVTTVHITVLDHNDEPPVFSSSLYKGAINEDALPGTIIITVTSTDRDLGDNTLVRYYITDGNPLGQFNIRNTGEVYVNKALDREATPFYELTVSATDGAFVSEAKIGVTVLDANDNAPVCDQPMYITSISENVPIGSYVIKVAATDADEEGTRNAYIEYRIDGEGASTFAMHRKTGIITTRRNLDRERVSEYQLTVDARDGGSEACTMEVFVTITDINDNEPVFSQPYYTVSIPENAEINTLITRVSAVDRDLGINRKVRYAMKESNGHFIIDPVSGIISLTRQLDREEQARFNLTLYAYDQGNPKMTSISYLIVRLLDINDNPPEFEHNMYSHNVREDTHVGMSLMRVFATSRDTGVNAEITYSITGGNEHGKFRVDSKTGAMAVIQPLDYEAAREYVLTVVATDGGTPPLSSTTVVRFNVTDANDNAPIFTQSSYQASVREDAQPQHNVIQVVALDADSAPNGQLTYMIIGGDPKNVFTINRRDGFISVAGGLDRETVPGYTLEVQAVDSGHPRLTGVVRVAIEILDANDNAPQFTLDNYTAVVQVDEKGHPSPAFSEDKSIGYSIILLSVMDNDIEPNAGPFSFDIVDGNQGNEFRIDREGHLSTVARFERQIKDSYILVVRVFDNGSPPLFSDTSITIRIIEESAFQPVITSLQITVTASNDEFPGGIIGRVKAYDRDLYDRLRFAIASNDHEMFSIHSEDGTLQAIQSLDAGDYHINVSVTDGKYFTYSEVQLLIVGIDLAMGNNAVVVRLEHVLPEEFLSQHKDQMSRVIEKELSIPSGQIFFLSIQPASNTVITPARVRRSTDSDLDVLIAVRKTPESFFRGNALRRKLSQMSPELEKKMGVKIKKIFNDVCEKGTCDEKVCETEVHFYPDTILSILTDDQSYVTARHALEPRCKCRYGARGCDMVDACNPNPCRGPHICKLEGQLGYKCDCPEGKTGENCAEDITVICTDPKCHEGKPMTFNGQSYAWWRLTDPNERRFSLQFFVKTLQASTAALMFAVGRVDHSILEMVNGRLQYRFDCGSGEGLVRVDSMPVNDGNWHAVSIERRGNSAEIVIDNIHKEQSSAPGTNDVLNLDSNAVYFGSEVLNPTKGFTDIHNSFKGCLRDIKINGVTLPYSGSNRVASIVKFENVEFHCKRAYIPGVCSSSPCFNGGTCIPKGVDKYMCHCHSRFVGGRCEVDTNPCASNPCKHAGNCENLSNDYRCQCNAGLSGKQCQRGFYCRRPSNPCQNGGICRDGDSGPVCNCNGFAGDFCEQDLDECLVMPCQNGGTCLNSHGSFKCTCQPDTTGYLCQETSFSSIKSTPFNITIEEIIGIAGVIVGLLIIVIIFVVVVRWRRRKRRERLHQAGAASNRDDFFNCDDLKRSNKMKNMEMPANMVQNIPPTPRNINPSPRPSPRPPPVPNRPASYTPSTADSVNTLNNFDTVCNYGSAGDELENIGTLQHIEIPEFLQNLDIEKSPTHIRTLPPPPHGPRVEDAQQKSSWDHNNPNIAQNYPYDEFKKHHKTMPTGKRSAPLPGSITSLPVSEADDELQASSARGKKKGYHWDASDWAPNPSLPNITELPMKEVPDSPSTSSRSNESNIHIDPNDEYDFTDYHDDTDYVDGNESEYVGDSEYAENECGDDDDDMDDPNSDFPDPPNFEHILAMHSDLSQPEDTGIPTNYNLHPDHYLPTYQMESGASQEDWPDDGNGNADNIARDDEEDVIHYGFPRPKQPRFVSHDYQMPLDYTPDYDHPTMSAIDDMSVSMGGYTSTNASCSDISGLCEIEDSEVNMSDNDSDHERRPSKKSHSHIHTQV